MINSVTRIRTAAAVMTAAPGAAAGRIVHPQTTPPPAALPASSTAPAGGCRRPQGQGRLPLHPPPPAARRVSLVAEERHARRDPIARATAPAPRATRRTIAVGRVETAGTFRSPRGSTNSTCARTTPNPCSARVTSRHAAQAWPTATARTGTRANRTLSPAHNTAEGAGPSVNPANAPTANVTVARRTAPTTRCVRVAAAGVTGMIGVVKMATSAATTSACAD